MENAHAGARKHRHPGEYGQANVTAVRKTMISVSLFVTMVLLLAWLVMVFVLLPLVHIWIRSCSLVVTLLCNLSPFALCQARQP